MQRAPILTALGLEYQAVREHLEELKEETHPKGTVYERGRFGEWEVLLAQIGAGNVGAAQETERAIEHLDAQVAFFVGVAGGRKDVALGDVVAATKVYGYESGKAGASFRPRPELGRSSYSLEQRARAEARKVDWLGRILGARPEPAPRAFVGPIAAGEKVVAATRSAVAKFLTESYGDALAVEMEGFGFLAAVRAREGVLALVVRGISDLLSGKRRADASGSQERAARHAAAFAFEVLAKLRPGQQPAAEPEPEPGAGAEIRIERDASNNIVIVGDHNRVVLAPAGPELSAEERQEIETGRLHPEELPYADPRPTLQLEIAFADEERKTWTLTPSGGEPRQQGVPWRTHPHFGSYLHTFWKLTSGALTNEADRGRLDRAALELGEALAEVLTPAERELLIAGGRSEGLPPYLVIEAADDLPLALPWELLRLDGAWPVLAGALDIARTIPAPGAPELEPPAEPLSLLVNVSAPKGLAGLGYEEESYLIARALHHTPTVRVNEMGELGDLVAGLRREGAPRAVHFSGHGGPGTLSFENAFGEEHEVSAEDLVANVKQGAGSGRLPRLFYLACCYGHTPPRLGGAGDGTESKKGVTSTAAQLHRQGIAQVVGHFGPVYDRQSTHAEAAFYRALGEGHRTREAVRAARREMAWGEIGPRENLRAAAAAKPRGATPYAWAQMVLYHRGPDYPLGRPLPAGHGREEAAVVRREEAEAFAGSRTQVLRHGFIGRREELHRLRRRLRDGRHVHVVQGMGGLGKSAYCQEAVRLYVAEGRMPLFLWCLDVEESTNPASDLVTQFVQLFGGALEGLAAAVDRVEDPGRRLAIMLGRLLGQEGLPPLVLYLDNLESLMHGPKTSESGRAEWRDADCAGLWHELLRLARGSAGRLALLASCRYGHPDLEEAYLPFGPMSPDTLFRMTRWFPSLRQLSVWTLDRLVGKLDGHPRSVEFLDPLVRTSLSRHRKRYGEPAEVTSRAEAAKEWQQLVAPALPKLSRKLSQDLVFAALWEQFLGEAERRTLLRLTVLRRPAAWDLLRVFGDPEAEEEKRDTVLQRLQDASLLAEFRQRQPDGGERLEFSVHSLVAELAAGQEEDAAALEVEGFSQAAEAWEARAARTGDVAVHLDASYYLLKAGEIDRAANRIWPLAQWFGGRGRYREGFEILSDFLTPESSAGISLRTQGVVAGVAGECLVGLGKLEGAAASFSLAVEVQERLSAQDPSNASWQRDLSVSLNKVGDVHLAQGQLVEALGSFQKDLAIAERLSTQDPSNAEWQRDLSVSLNKVGDVHLAQGQLVEALGSFQRSQEIAERLSAQDPSNASWQRDLSVSLNKVGDVHLAQGQLSEALEMFLKAREISERLAGLDPSNAQWQEDLQRLEAIVSEIRTQIQGA